MFNLKVFIKENLMSGYRSKAFTAEQVNIYAANYHIRGIFSAEDVQEISDLSTAPIEETVIE